MHEPRFFSFFFFFFLSTCLHSRTNGKLMIGYVWNFFMIIYKYVFLPKLQTIRAVSDYNRRHFPELQGWSWGSSCLLWIISTILCPLIILLLKQSNINMISTIVYTQNIFDLKQWVINLFIWCGVWRRGFSTLSPLCYQKHHFT